MGYYGYDSYISSDSLFQLTHYLDLDSERVTLSLEHSHKPFIIFTKRFSCEIVVLVINWPFCYFYPCFDSFKNIEMSSVSSLILSNNNLSINKFN